MSERARRVAFLLAAIAGYAAFVILFPKMDRAARVGFRLDASSAVESARAAAQRFGFRISPLDASTSYRLDENAIRQTTARSSTTLPSELTGVGARVRLRGDGVTAVADMDGQGRITAVDIRGNSTRPAVSDAAAQALGTKWLDTLGGTPSAAYRLAERSSDKGVAHFVWTRIDDPLRRAEAFVRDASAPSVRLFATAASKNRPLRVFENATGFAWAGIVFLLVVLALVAGSMAIARGEARFRWALAAALPLVVFAVVEGALVHQRILAPWEESGVTKQTEATLQLVFMIVVLPLLRMIVCGLAWAAGRAALIQRDRVATHAVDRLFTGRVSEKSAARAVLAGVAFAGAVAAVPLIVTALSAGSLTGTSVTGGRGQLLFAQLPLAALIAHAGRSALWDVLPLFGCLVPLVDAKFGKRAVANGLALVAGAGWLGEMSLFGRGETMMGVVAGIASAALLLLLYRTFGLASVIVASSAAEVLRSGAMFALRPALVSELTAAGAIALILGVAAVALVVRKRGREEEAEPVTTGQWTPAVVASSDRLRAEMDLARSMQDRLMRNAIERVPGFEISSICRAAKEVGGDLYAVVPLRGDRFALALAVADVAGKGLPAALTMTLTKGLLLGAAEESSDAKQIAAILNEGVRTSSDRRTFVTAVVVVLDPDTRRCTVVRAGHTPAMLVRSGQRPVELLRPDGFALGLTASAKFGAALTAVDVDLAPGDTLVLYSDGVTEAMNPGADEFGEERLAELIERHRGSSAEEMQRAIVDEVTRFRDGAAPNDDMTIAIVKAV